jgi:transcriptional regulator with XRE-family HTH domain
MEELAKSLRQARSSHGLTLEAASAAARISPAYLHKLEAGRVQTPSPHVLRRLASALAVPYLTLMTLAGYLDHSEPPASRTAEVDRTSRRGGESMKQTTASKGPTNAEIVRLLQAVQAELAELRRGQEELAKTLGKTSARKSEGRRP